MVGKQQRLETSSTKFTGNTSSISISVSPNTDHLLSNNSEQDSPKRDNPESVKFAENGPGTLGEEMPRLEEPPLGTFSPDSSSEEVG
jgi:hypothetical protein